MGHKTRPPQVKKQQTVSLRPSLLLRPSRLRIGSQLSRAWVRFVLGPKNTKGPSCLGSELSGSHSLCTWMDISITFLSRGGNPLILPRMGQLMCIISLNNGKHHGP